LEFYNFVGFEKVYKKRLLHISVNNVALGFCLYASAMATAMNNTMHSFLLISDEYYLHLKLPGNWTWTGKA